MIRSFAFALILTFSSAPVFASGFLHCSTADGNIKFIQTYYAPVGHGTRPPPHDELHPSRHPRPPHENNEENNTDGWWVDGKQVANESFEWVATSDIKLSEVRGLGAYGTTITQYVSHAIQCSKEEFLTLICEKHFKMDPMPGETGEE